LDLDLKLRAEFSEVLRRAPQDPEALILRRAPGLLTGQLNAVGTIYQ